MAQKPTHASWTALSAENKNVPTIQEKKAALREIPNNSKPAEAPLLSKDKICMSDSSANKIIGTKRPNPSSPASPLTYTYVRRRLETEQGKVNSSPLSKEEKNKEQNLQGSQVLHTSPVSQTLQNSHDSQNLQIPKDSQNLQNDSKGALTKAAKLQNGSDLDVNEATKLQNGSKGGVSEATKQDNGPKGEVSEATKPQNEATVEAMEATKPQTETKRGATEATKPASLTARQDWRERFIRLQTFLKSCDQSSQEDYIRMLRSLSAVGRSKHAVELEKRAIHLLLEEGKELHRMKVLNVLGKGAPSDPSLYPSQLSPSTWPQLQR